ncbi:MAG TPA: YCF48-related protein [Solirubrobacteraceae bacterium]|nr:YCF48-related protein [Solirubrobacteraceae bacterium]
MRKLVVVCVAGVLAAFGLLAPGALANVSVGHSGWGWSNPLPQGQTLRSLVFMGARGYAAGDFGTVLRTDDGGLTWTGLATGVTSDLAKISLISSDSAVIAGGCTARRTDDAGATFNRLPFSNTDVGCAAKLVSESFVGPAGFLLLEDGSVLHTMDGGATFAASTAVPGTAKAGGSVIAKDVTFTDPNTGFAVTSTGQIFRTTDAAGSWTLVTTASKALNRIIFTSATTAYAVGDASTVLKSADAGVTWTPMAITAGLPVRNLVSIGCANSLVCLVANDTGAGLFRTTDGGVTWTFVVPSDQPIFGVAFSTLGRAVAVGGLGNTVVSDDSGATWRPAARRIAARFTRLSATSSTLVFAYGRQGSLARSVDGGETYVSLAVPTSADVLGGSFPTDQVGFALDSSGVLLRTDNGGASWQNLNTGTTSKVNDVWAADPNTILLATDGGLLKSSNGGSEFSPLGKAVKGGLDRLQATGGTVVASGSRAILVSDNGGATFKSIKAPNKSGLQSVDFVSGSLAYAVDGRDHVYRTANGGRVWKEQLAIANDGVRKVSFSSATDGYALPLEFGGDTSGGTLLHTADGGAHWAPELISSSQLVDVAAAGGTDFALANDKNIDGGANLFSTATGGAQGTPTTLTITAKPRTIHRKTKVTISGTLSPANGKEQVVVSNTFAKGGNWANQTVTVASNGTFTASATIKKTSVFVAQWSGDSGRSGAGSSVLTVRKK